MGGDERLSFSLMTSVSSEVEGARKALRCGGDMGVLVLDGSAG